jgi:hypothetical protein
LTEQDSYTISKQRIAIVIVVLDLCIGFYLWISLLIVKPLERKVTLEID